MNDAYIIAITTAEHNYFLHTIGWIKEAIDLDTLVVFMYRSNAKRFVDKLLPSGEEGLTIFSLYDAELVPYLPQ